MPSLALCVIVGVSEAGELERLMLSAQGDLFDEILITCTQDDPAVQAVAEKYATKVSYFKWCDDFSAARNFNMQQASSDFIMWLDADDEIPKESYDKLLEVRKTLDDHDSVYLTYNYSWNKDGSPYLVLPRERIVRVATGARWNDPIHEWLSIPQDARRLDRPDICINHRRTREYDSGRNLSILRKMYEEGKASPRLKFYYAKDLFDSGERQVSLQVFNEYLVGEMDFHQNKAIACLRMAAYCQEIHDTPAAERFWNASIAFCPEYAEPYYHLGKVAEGRGHLEKALSYFKEATDKNPQSAFAAQPYYYRMYPCSSLVFILSKMKRYREADYFNNKNMEWYPGNLDYIFNRRYLQGKIQEQQARLLSGVRTGWQTPAPAGAENIEPLPELFRRHPVRSLAEVFDVIVINEISEDAEKWVDEAKGEGIRVIVELLESPLQRLSVKSSVLLKADGVICRDLGSFQELQKIRDNVFFWPGVNGEDTLWEYNFAKAEMGPIRVATDDGLEGTHYPEQIRGSLIPMDRDNFPGLLTCDAYLNHQECNPESLARVRKIMATGLPVICPQSFQGVIDDGVDGFLYSDLIGLTGIFEMLSNPLVRIRAGVLGQDSCRRGKLSKSYQNRQLREIINGVWDRSLGGKAIEKPQAPVPIVIPVYESIDYLNLCLGSIVQNTLSPHYLILSDAGSSQAAWDSLRKMNGALLIGAPEDRKNFSQAVNAACNLLGGSEYFVLLNSDVIVSHNWLQNLQGCMQKNPTLAACGVLSNCDRGWLHDREGAPSYPMCLPDVGTELTPGMTLEEITPNIQSLFKFMKESNKTLQGSFVEQEWVAYYATMFRTDDWRKTGALDPAFKNGCEDLDHARRLRLSGYKIGQALDAFVFHFGGISRGAYQAERREVDDAEDRANHITYANKWSRKRIAIFAGPAWEKWNRDSVDAGMAGSETWAAEIGAEFVKRGFAVTVFNDPVIDGEIDCNGVEYRNYQTFGWWQRYLHIDYVIISRTCEPLKYLHVHSRNVYVIAHDTTLLDGYNSRVPLLTPPRKFGCLSNWHLEYFTERVGIAREKAFITANGVRGDLYGAIDHSLKKNRAIYSSSPDRGLLVLLQMLPRIRKHVPDFELVVTYGFGTWKACAQYYQRHEDLSRIQEIEELLKQPGVVYLGRVPKKELAELQKGAKVWLYPTWFTETWCISLVEQGFAGNAVVTTPLAGILTTGGDAPVYVKGPEGIPVEKWCFTPEYQEEFIKQTVLLLRYEGYRRDIADRVSRQTSKYTWEAAADGWLREWQIL